MQGDSINRTRYRTLRVAAALLALLASGGLVTMLQLPQVHPAELGLFVVAVLLGLLVLPLAHRAHRRGDRQGMERLGMAAVIIAAVLLIERIASTLYGPLFKDPTVDLFRLHYACIPVLYLMAVAVLRTRVALRFNWIVWVLVLALTLPGLYLRTGFDPGRAGLAAVLVWVLLANPLFILLMHAMPHYEDALDRSAAELARMRERTELMDRLTESERRFNLVVESLQVGVWDRWLRPRARRWWSPRFYELIGYAPEELEPTEKNLRALMHPDDRERVWQEGSEQLRRGDIMDVNFRIKTRHLGYRWFNSHAKAERDAEGRIVRIAGAIDDIHDRRTAEDSLRAAQVELTHLAYRDTLTSLYNRRYFDEHFQREWERARRSRQPLALLLVDLDHFKAYNDRYGHPAGDACLVQIAQLLTRCAGRPADIVARIGGEEFGMVLPETTVEGAEEVAQRLQSQLRAAALPHQGSPAQIVTLSIGIAMIEDADGPGPSEMFEQADKALYEVKRRGRDGILRYWGRAKLGEPHAVYEVVAPGGSTPR